MSLADTIRAFTASNPVVQSLRAKDAFVATDIVTLRRWDELDEASWWCVRQWRDYDCQYRRRVRAEDCQATFEFPNAEDAMVFLLKFGGSAKSC